MNESEKEYVIFTEKTKAGDTVEMAVVDEFEFERKYYVAAALVVDDEIKDDNLFIYRLILKGKVDYSVEKITNPEEYSKVSEAYLEMQ